MEFSIIVNKNLIMKKTRNLLQHILMLLFMVAFCMIAPQDLQAQKKKRERQRNARQLKNMQFESNFDNKRKTVQRLPQGAKKPHWRYRALPAVGAKVTTLPTPYVNIFNKADKLIYSEGVFYRRMRAEYVVVLPSIGLRVKSLPEKTKKIDVAGIIYFYYYGTFYKKIRNEYEVVRAPLDAVVRSIPKGYQKQNINMDLVFTLGGVNYLAVIKSAQDIRYRVTRSN